jgi:hypothetical protein
MKYFIEEIYGNDFSEIISLVMTHDVLYDHMRMMLSDFLKATKVHMKKNINHATWEANIPLTTLWRTHPDIIEQLLRLPTGQPIQRGEMTFTLSLPDCYGDC